MVRDRHHPEQPSTNDSTSATTHLNQTTNRNRTNRQNPMPPRPRHDRRVRCHESEHETQHRPADHDREDQYGVAHTQPGIPAEILFLRDQHVIRVVNAFHRVVPTLRDPTDPHGCRARHRGPTARRRVVRPVRPPPSSARGDERPRCRTFPAGAHAPVTRRARRPRAGIQIPGSTTRPGSASPTVPWPHAVTTTPPTANSAATPIRIISIDWPRRWLPTAARCSRTASSFNCRTRIGRAGTPRGIDCSPTASPMPRTPRRQFTSILEKAIDP